MMSLAGSEMEVLEDFRKALAKIDFNEYNPKSEDYKCAMFIGLMWLLLKHLGEEEGGHEWADDIMEEMEGARKYIDLLKSTGNEMYRSMAHDELHHAELLVKQYKETHKEGSSWIDMIVAEHKRMGDELSGDIRTEAPNVQNLSAIIGRASAK